MEPTLCPRIYVERTLALLKPDAIHRAEEIEDDILKSGFTILQVGSDCKVYNLFSFIISIMCQQSRVVYSLFKTALS